MDRSVAQGRPADPRTDGWSDVRSVPWLAAAVGVGFVIVALAVYTRTLIDRPYDHFVWQAAAFLEGQAAIRYPVPGQRVLPGRAAGRPDRRHPARADPVPTAARHHPRAVRRARRAGHERTGRLRGPRRARRRDLLVAAWAAAAALLGADRGDRLLRVWHGLLVRRAAQHDLVPGPRRRDRPGDARNGVRDRRGPRSGRHRGPTGVEPRLPRDDPP